MTLDELGKGIDEIAADLRAHRKVQEGKRTFIGRVMFSFVFSIYSGVLMLFGAGLAMLLD